MTEPNEDLLDEPNMAHQDPLFVSDPVREVASAAQGVGREPDQPALEVDTGSSQDFGDPEEGVERH
ncbi:MAG: hypothetical protein H0U58_09575 [Chloroflexi bacterium]|nr:hypothetical protein [Chloroflexota bacterium]